MIRATIAFVALFAAALAAAWLADNPGQLVVNWQGWRLEAPVAVVLIGLLLLFGLAGLLYRAWLWLGRSPEVLARNRDQRRERQGYEALTKGLVAVAAGDASQARTLARQAENLLQAPPLTRLLSAQAAQLDGDDVSARHYFEEMLDSKETEFLALRGLLTSALREGDRVAALDYATRAHRARPDADWATKTLFDIQAQAGLWKEAQATLADASRQNAMPAEDTTRRKAIAQYAQAQAAEATGDRRGALKLFDQAHSAAPGLVPVAVDGARLLLAAKKIRRASDMVETCWQENPHPALANIYQALWSNEKPGYVMQRLDRLHALRPGSREGRMALAAKQIEARKFEDARTLLAPLVADTVSSLPEQRLCRLMADLEEGMSGNAAAARDWLVKVETAPADPAWACTECGAITPDWAPHCPACEAFDALVWQALPEPATGSSSAPEALVDQGVAAQQDDPDIAAPSHAPTPDIDERPASA
ncbi:MAG: heme biosynthesis protein HemY [Alphaproteobacteria bacterium]|jgi:HemY protein|nr:heme biosynthesis protein HemY [Alphaproteobacteria bacterium]MBT4966314.1 heme biosynthesis protein HemY [Alphaproteobacteria bacterium]MBT5160019.1 heme biosynthesis protein HemY [Alphaproteobacteria bacterium]MBT5919974.1 heme biosynthesis protein HemY [Alphaproteobacteria bacterium]MBT6384866.1 heme biosynthesis protein HemY [Alphaproteobacteria bacterium]